MDKALPPSPPVSPPVTPALSRRWLLVFAVLVLLSLLMPSGWPGRPIAPWVPAVGLGVALTVWLGYTASLLLVPAGVLAAFRNCLMMGDAPLLEALGQGLVEGVWQSILTTAVVWGYRRLFQGEVELSEPRSASCFMLAPILVACLVSPLRTLLVWVISPFPTPLIDAAAHAISLVLGVVVLTPPLLVYLTPLLIDAGLVRRDGWWLEARPMPIRPSFGIRPRRLLHPDKIEIALLTGLTIVMSVLLTVTQDPKGPGGWQLWGVPLLLVVWAGIRQGRHGATLSAGAGTAASLVALSMLGPEVTGRMPLQLQGNLIALCVAALLVAASVSWIRASEQRYRQVVTQIPVVLYSTFIRESSPANQPPRADVLFVNHAAKVVFGCPLEELLGDHRRWMERVHVDDREILRAALMQLARQNQPVICEYRLAPIGSLAEREQPSSTLRTAFRASRSPLPQPRFRWVRDLMVPQLDERGQLIGWEGMASDITEQRMLADDLRRTTSMFHTLVANLPAGVFFVSAGSGRPILVNQRARQLLGQREDASAALEHLSSVYRLHRPDGTLYPTSELPVQQALERGIASMRDDIVVHRPDGRKIPLISWAAPVNLGQGSRTDAVVWVLEDLTELRQAEAARRESEGRLRTVIESLAEGLLVQDRQEAVIDSNPACRTLLGNLLDRPQALAEAGWLRDDGSALPPDEFPIRRVLRSGVPLRNVIVGLPSTCPPNEQPRWLLLTSLPLVPRAGTTPAGVVSTLADITEHIHAQHLVRISEDRYRRLVDSLPLMLIQFDREMNITLANPAMQETSGFTADEVRTPDVWSERIHADDQDTVQAGFREALAGRSARLECRYRARDGQEHSCLVFLEPIWDQQPGVASPVGLTALVVDLTRERRLEQELQRAQRLELVGRLSSGITHDFNNLLMALLNLTRLAGMKLSANDPLTEDLHQIEEVGEQATRLAQQILGFCKQKPPVPRRVDVQRATQRIADIFRTLLPTTVQFECLLCDEDLFVMADEIQLQQVVMNLCLNARDAMPNGGRLKLRTRVEIRDQGAEWVCLSVEDSGEGMSEAVRQKIFEPFFSTKERGSGLGLSVVQQIITSFGGSVEVASEAGRGSRFQVWLPRLR